MWKFSDLNSSIVLRLPPDGRQQENSYSMVFPTLGSSPYGCNFSGKSSFPSSVFKAQGSFLRPYSSLVPPLDPANGSSGPVVFPQAKRFLVFDHSGDQTSLVFSSVANPMEDLNAALPVSNASEEKEMTEDPEEIDALLYSDSEYTVDTEEASTGHSPLDMEEEEADISPVPAKRRRIRYSELDELLVDSASSSRACCAELSYIGEGGGKLGDGGCINCEKRKRIQATVNVLKRIIPGGKGKDAASVLDEAIQYLKTLKLQAMALGANTSTL
ncbi:Transcription factor bHLH145 [Apostasia shenzhenica]|uniref:Transcription factor bHLH145 n=1 Tax=Apostasia shenzhenica TaxID=1088818 RepID=A0A2I0A1U6_9ASPA|nr:Transcription factor bHLH145 [Apostasia shenzhenica]